MLVTDSSFSPSAFAFAGASAFVTGAGAESYAAFGEAEQFIVGDGPAAAVEGLHRLWRGGSAFTVDLLGEKTVTEVEADRYAARVDDLLRTLLAETEAWAPDDVLEHDEDELRKSLGD